MRFLGANIGNCTHTEGLYKAARIAKMAGIETYVCKANSTNEQILNEISRFNPDFIGFSYRLSPQKGIDELKKIINKLEYSGLLYKLNGDSRLIAFAGLPQTIEILKSSEQEFRIKIYPIPQVADALKQINIVFDFFKISHNIRESIINDIKEELFPPEIEMLNQLADSVVEDDNYLKIQPLPIPSEAAKKDLIVRMSESPYPLLRSHFGIPSVSIKPTIDGIRNLANSRAIDEVSIGSSDLSQRYYGKPKEFKDRINDGGVPYQNIKDLRELFLASRSGNFPSCKPYAHTTGILDFIDDCIATGHLTGAHQAVPLFWFNQLDGRGATSVRESIIEHIAAVSKLAKLGIPVEMNDPNQWSSRWAHDTIVAADYAIISAVMLENGVRDIILQMQFNKPIETSDFGDIAKMKTGAYLARKMKELGGFSANIHHETRTGIEYFSTDLKHAKWQLARSTLLQMFLNPEMIHIVSYCEAVRAAEAEDIIESSKIIRKAVDVFRSNEYDLRKNENDSLITERMEFLKGEADFLLTEIAKLDKHFNKNQPITKFLSNPDTIYQSIEKGLMAAPGIMNPDFKNERLITKPMKNGFFNAVDFVGGEMLREKERLSKLQN